MGGHIDGLYSHVADITARAHAPIGIPQRELIAMHERERVAAEINDLVTRRLFALSVDLAAILTTGNGDQSRRIAAAIEDLDVTIRGLRGKRTVVRVGRRLRRW